MSEDQLINETNTEETKTETPSVKELVDTEVAKAIKNIKSNLDSAYQQRDAALAEVALAKEEKQKAEIRELHGFLNVPRETQEQMIQTESMGIGGKRGSDEIEKLRETVHQ